MIHQRFKVVPFYSEEAITNAASGYFLAENAQWVTIIIIEDQHSGAGTAHNWSIYALDASGGTADVMTTGVSVWSETDIAVGTLVDTFAAATLTAGVWAADTTASTWQCHVIEIDPACMGTNATSGLPNKWLAIYPSAGSANSNAHAVALLEYRYQQATPPTAIA